MKTKQALKQQLPCDCITAEEHQEHLERNEDRAPEILSNLQWIALTRSGGVYKQPPKQDTQKAQFNRAY